MEKLLWQIERAKWYALRFPSLTPPVEVNSKAMMETFTAVLLAEEPSLTKEQLRKKRWAVANKASLTVAQRELMRKRRAEKK